MLFSGRLLLVGGCHSSKESCGQKPSLMATFLIPAGVQGYFVYNQNGRDAAAFKETEALSPATGKRMKDYRAAYKATGDNSRL